MAAERARKCTCDRVHDMLWKRIQSNRGHCLSKCTVTTSKEVEKITSTTQHHFLLLVVLLPCQGKLGILFLHTPLSGNGKMSIFLATCILCNLPEPVAHMMGKIGQMGLVIRILELKHIVDKIAMRQLSHCNSTFLAV